MQFEDFQSGTWIQQYKYKSFLPVPVSYEWTWQDPRINVLLEQATQALGELNAYTRIVPDVDLYIKMHITLEANTSSGIEGTNTTIDEAVMDERSILPERRDDWHEVRNYINAMNNALEQLVRLPLSMRLLRDTHEILLKGTRGEHKSPGEFRRSQNWIGGASLTDAAFVPPHHTVIDDLLTDLEKFWHNESIAVPHLIRIAISHYQFETIHPFLDGNGRIGRLLIPLYLISNCLLDKPSLYLSAHLFKNRGIYYDSLTRVRESNDIGQWVRFFLTAVVETAGKGRKTFESILTLRQEMDQFVVSFGRRAADAHNLMLLLYNKPVLDVRSVQDELGISYERANRLIATFTENDILAQVPNRQRDRIFMFKRYLRLFKDE
ncbi:MAG: Fic family protein [Candidatus Hydrogenedentes bacterium]|nr:Fic family protein [Candidatus Hydrogenedentota bacterium]